MNKNFFAGLFAGLCLLAVFAFKPAAEKPVVAVQKWEYLEVTYKPSLQKKEATYFISDGTGPTTERTFVAADGPSCSIQVKNEMGKQGWELVSHEGPTNTGSVSYPQPWVFKRPVQ
ncbi:MAG TPA: hypothetical protein VHS96_12925 [Bacteroidia bacterium]|nr:hypothetical protein [Bacteroidia bacterium]